MKYVTGIHGLNTDCSLETCGDWHQSGIQWDTLTIWESDGSILGDYGIEFNKKIPENKKLFNVANHIRSLLDLLIASKFCYAQGMKDEFIVVDIYDKEIFEKVSLLKACANWPDIDYFMAYEYREKWLDYKKDNFIYPIIPDKSKVITKQLFRLRKQEDDHKDFFPELISNY